MSDFDNELARLKETYQSDAYAALADPLPASPRRRRRFGPRLTMICSAGAAACLVGFIVWGINRPDPEKTERPRLGSRQRRSPDERREQQAIGQEKVRSAKPRRWLPSFSLVRNRPRKGFAVKRRQPRQHLRWGKPVLRVRRFASSSHSFRLPVGRKHDKGSERSKQIRFQFL